MNNKEKKEKKQFISQSINLDNGRFKDSEINLLVDLVKNWNKFNGLSKIKTKIYDSWSSDGKYTRNEKTTYTFQHDLYGIFIKESYEFQDDDGLSGSSDTVHRTARSILRLLNTIFN